jgi:hypothetical protein
MISSDALATPVIDYLYDGKTVIDGAETTAEDLSEIELKVESAELIVSPLITYELHIQTAPPMTIEVVARAGADPDYVVVTSESDATYTVPRRLVKAGVRDATEQHIAQAIESAKPGELTLIGRHFVSCVFRLSVHEDVCEVGANGVCKHRAPLNSYRQIHENGLDKAYCTEIATYYESARPTRSGFMAVLVAYLESGCRSVISRDLSAFAVRLESEMSTFW